MRGLLKAVSYYKKATSLKQMCSLQTNDFTSKRLHCKQTILLQDDDTVSSLRQWKAEAAFLLPLDVFTTSILYMFTVRRHLHQIHTCLSSVHVHTIRRWAWQDIPSFSVTQRGNSRRLLAFLPDCMSSCHSACLARLPDNLSAHPSNRLLAPCLVCIVLPPVHLLSCL